MDRRRGWNMHKIELSRPCNVCGTTTGYIRDDIGNIVGYCRSYYTVHMKDNEPADAFGPSDFWLD